jgi:hypothetical protein
MSTKWQAQNTYLFIGDEGSPEQFFKVVFLQDINLPKRKADLIDVSTQDETDHYYDYLATMLDSGEATFQMVWDPTDPTHNNTATVAGVNAGGLEYLFNSRAKRNMRFAMPTNPATRLRFVASVTGLVPDAKVKGALMQNVTLKVSGKATLEAGSGTGA